MLDSSSLCVVRGGASSLAVVFNEIQGQQKVGLAHHDPMISYCMVLTAFCGDMVHKHQHRLQLHLDPDSDMALSSSLGRKTSWPWAVATQVGLLLVTAGLPNTTKASGRCLHPELLCDLWWHFGLRFQQTPTTVGPDMVLSSSWV